MIRRKFYPDTLTVNGNWRVIYKFEEKNAILINYLDYH